MGKAPPIDPTQNVLALVKAAVERLDDMASLRSEVTEEKISSLRREIDLRAQHSRDVSEAEARRNDALRELDRLEVRTANERHQAAVDVLAKGVENTRQTLAVQTDSVRREFDVRISALERLQSAGAGKGLGMNALWGYIVAAIMLLLAIWGKLGK